MAFPKLRLTLFLIELAIVISVVTLSNAKDNVGYDEDDNACKNADGSESDACIKCNIMKKSSDELMLSDAAKKFFGKKENRKNEKHTLSQLQVFHCQCVKTSDGKLVKGVFDYNEDAYNQFSEFEDDGDDDDFDEDWEDWKKSEVLKISDCDDLELKLGGDIQEKLDNDAEGKQTILVVENIKKLKLDFSLAEPDEGRFTSVSFRNVTFSDEEDSLLIFSKDSTKDAIEFLFDDINVPRGTFKIEQQNSNTDDDSVEYGTNPILMITNSTLGSPVNITDLVNAMDNKGYVKSRDDFSDSDDFEENVKFDFKITVANLQRDKSCVEKEEDDEIDDEDKCDGECNFDYMGNIKINMNRFSYLNNEAISILGAKKFEFFGNTASFVVKNALHIANVKNLNISENRFEMIGKTPALKIVYEYSAYDLSKNDDYFPTGLSRDFDKEEFEDTCNKKDEKSYASMSQSDIESVDISKNFFGTFQKDTIDFKISEEDEKYTRDFVVEKFAPKMVSSRAPCKCPIPKPSENDEYETSKSNNLTMMGLMKLECLSPQYPPVMGKREEICKGKYPKPVKERLEEAKKGIKPWHLILAILLSIMITAIVVFVIVRFCCTPEESKSRSVSPNP